MGIVYTCVVIIIAVASESGKYMCTGMSVSTAYSILVEGIYWYMFYTSTYLHISDEANPVLRVLPGHEWIIVHWSVITCMNCKQWESLVHDFLWATFYT